MALILPNAPFGLALYTGGSSYLMTGNVATIPLTTTSNFYQGTLLKKVAGLAVPAAPSDTGLIGVSNMINALPASNQYFQFDVVWLANTSVVTGTIPTVYYSLTDVSYVVQIAGGTNILLQSDVGKFANLSASSGDSITGHSTQYLDLTTLNATAGTLAVQILEILPSSIDKSSSPVASGAYGLVRVKFNPAAL